MFHQGGRGGPPMARLSSSVNRDVEDDEKLSGKIYNAGVIRRLAKYLVMVWQWMALGASGTIIRSVAAIFTPYITGLIIDHYIRTENSSGLNVVVWSLVGLALFTWLGQYLETLYLTYAGQGILFKLRTQLCTHLFQLSMHFFSINKTGKLMSRVQNDVDQLQTLVAQDVISLLANFITLAGIIIIMISMDARLALITLTVVPVMLILILVWQLYARRTFMRVRTAIAVVNDKLQEGISGVRVTQSLSREEVNIEEFTQANKANLDANISAARLQALMMPAVDILTNISFALVLIYGGKQVLEGTLGVGVLVAFLLYIQRFFQPIMELVSLYTDVQRAMVSGTRIFELLDVENEVKDKPGAIELPKTKGDIAINHVYFGYKPDVNVLNDINLKINSGETVAIVGRTGAGKSSLANLITRLYDVKQGQILLDGYDVTGVTQESLRRQIGVVPQEPYLFSGSIEDNIRNGRDTVSQDEIVKAAQATGAHNFISGLPDGYKTFVGERGANLSAGQRQLICLARAILSDPPILILDEATSSIDTNTERIMQSSMLRLSKGRTCIVIAHRLSTITNANKIIVLEHGKLIETGKHEELLNKKGVYFEMFQALSNPNTISTEGY